MGSNRKAKPVKLFIAVLKVPSSNLEERLEEELISEFGPTDHRLSLISSDETIHCVFLSFDRLTDEESLSKIRELCNSFEEEFSAQLDAGFLDNRRAAVGTTDGDLLQFKDGGIQFFPRTHSVYKSGKSEEFFLLMRKSFRAQLRSMCLLRVPR